MTNRILQKIKKFPKSPGVYQFIDANGDILYVGKAKSLKNRIKSYFINEIGRGPAIEAMMGKVSDVRYVESESEIEAILLEAELINKLKPKYNARQKDDKSFLVIKITKPLSSDTCHPRAGKAMTRGSKIENSMMDSRFRGNDKSDYDTQFSCVELVRARNVDFNNKSAEFFGPYPAGLLLKKSLNYLRKIFPFRDCSKTKFFTYRKKGRPCIYGDIKVCTAPCVEWVNKNEYQKNITYLKSFLKGRKKEIVKKISSDMKELSRAKKFEKAALLRDKIAALDHLKTVALGLRDDVFLSHKVLFQRIECFDVSNISGNYAVGSMAVFLDGKKSTDDYRKFKIKFTNKTNDLAMLKEILIRRFRNDWPKPDLLVIDGGVGQLNVAKEVPYSMKLNIPVISIAKGPKRDKNEFHFSDQNIAKYIKSDKELSKIIISIRDEAHRFAISYYRSLHRKGLFK